MRSQGIEVRALVRSSRLHAGTAVHGCAIRGGKGARYRASCQMTSFESRQSTAFRLQANQTHTSNVAGKRINPPTSRWVTFVRHRVFGNARHARGTHRRPTLRIAENTISHREVRRIENSILRVAAVDQKAPHSVTCLRGYGGIREGTDKGHDTYPTELLQWVYAVPLSPPLSPRVTIPNTGRVRAE